MPAICPFCGHKATSHEHIWGKWTQKVFESKRFPNTQNHQILVRRDSSRISVAKGTLRRKGEVLGQTFPKFVCETCNIGWMNAIENGMRKFYTSVAPSQSHIFSASSAKAIAEWAYLKLCLHNHEYPGLTGEITAQHRQKWSSFRTKRQVPHEYSLFVSFTGIFHDPICIHNYFPANLSATDRRAHPFHSDCILIFLGCVAIFLCGHGPIRKQLLADPRNYFLNQTAWREVNIAKQGFFSLPGWPWNPAYLEEIALSAIDNSTRKSGPSAFGHSNRSFMTVTKNGNIPDYADLNSPFSFDDQHYFPAGFSYPGST